MNEFITPDISTSYIRKLDPNGTISEPIGIATRYVDPNGVLVENVRGLNSTDVKWKTYYVQNPDGEWIGL